MTTKLKILGDIKKPISSNHPLNLLLSPELNVLV